MHCPSSTINHCLYIDNANTSICLKLSCESWNLNCCIMVNLTNCCNVILNCDHIYDFLYKNLFGYWNDFYMARWTRKVEKWEKTGLRCWNSNFRIQHQASWLRLQKDLLVHRKLQTNVLFVQLACPKNYTQNLTLRLQFHHVKAFWLWLQPSKMAYALAPQPWKNAFITFDQFSDPPLLH